MMILYLAPGFWILGVAGTTGGGLMMGFGIRALSRMVASGHWPTVEWRIISSRFVREGGRDRSEGDLAARIMYDYTVAGRRYVCEGVGF